MGSALQQPPRIPLVIDPENRYNSGSFDARLINAYMEQPDKLTKQFHVYKRPGYGSQQQVGATNAAGMGVYTWNGNVYSIFAGILYKNGAQVATGLDTTGGVYSFTEIKGSDPKIVMQNGVQGYAYDDTALLSANLYTTSGNVYPQYTVKGLAYLDGAVYVMQRFFGTLLTPAVIWGSAINSVTGGSDWDPLDFITAQIEPDYPVALNKQLSYVIAFKQWTTEVFLDAGNATGSPLQSVPGSKSRYGCAHQDSVQRIEDRLLWLSTNQSASMQVCIMDELQVKVVSTDAVDRLLNNANLSGGVYSWQLKVDGHLFYILTIVSNNLTLAYDIAENSWAQWQDPNGNYIPICASTYDSSGHKVIQHATNGSLYYMDSAYIYGDDNGSSIEVDIVTPNWDGDTRRNKQLSMLEFVGDKQPGNYFTVQVSDDDYQSWSQPRRVDMGYDRMLLPDCGTFRRRAWWIKFNQYGPFRIMGIEPQFDIGVL
jgi:hypothetical protein